MKGLLLVCILAATCAVSLQCSKEYTIGYNYYSQSSAATGRPSASNKPTPDHHWSYTKGSGPESWSASYPTCGGSLQSPVNIQLLPSQDRNFMMHSFDEQAQYTVKNNGHSVEATVPSAKRGLYELTLSGPNGERLTYKAVQFHFHWGHESTHGSEHALNGRFYPMEMHIVHYRSDLDPATVNLGEEGPTALAVLGFFFEVSEHNDAYNSLLNVVMGLGKEQNVEKTTDFMSLSSLLPDDLSQYYRYQGSLTTPSCNEVVVWTVFQSTIKIGETQLNIFRGTGVTDNFRPIQRTVSGDGSNQYSTRFYPRNFTWT